MLARHRAGTHQHGADDLGGQFVYVPTRQIHEVERGLNILQGHHAGSGEL